MHFFYVRLFKANVGGYLGGRGLINERPGSKHVILGPKRGCEINYMGRDI